MAPELQHLIARIPELEWKLGQVGTIRAHQLPPGLFRCQLEFTPTAALLEVKKDLALLKEKINEPVSYYLVRSISQKVYVLVRLCKMHFKRPKSSQAKMVPNLDVISSRQQWLKNTQNEIEVLTVQHKALQSALIALQKSGAPNKDAILTAQADVGDVEKRITLLREATAI